MQPSEIEVALNRLGELLAARGLQFRLVIVGGAALNLLGTVSRATTDVDILAFGDRQSDEPGITILPPPNPLPPELMDAARAVARSMGLRAEWLNAGPAGQWETGLPPGLEQRIEWRTFPGLQLGLVGRYDLIFLKLYAAADHTGPRSVHFQDLVALTPTPEELEAAGAWVVGQDPQLVNIVTEVARHVATALRRR